jgi:hypothetical protein
VGRLGSGVATKCDRNATAGATALLDAYLQLIEEAIEAKTEFMRRDLRQ